MVVADTVRTGATGAHVPVGVLAERVRPATLARDRILPVSPALAGLLPATGLRRGSTLAVSGRAATSLALAGAAAASQDGWVAVVGCASLGLSAAAELGVRLDRLVSVVDPPPAVWPSVVATLVDAFDMVLVRTTQPVRTEVARRLVVRARERRAVLVQVAAGADEGGSPDRWPWPEGADVTWRVTDSCWEGLGGGHGHLRGRQVTVEAGGRRGASRPRRVRLWLPSTAGVVEPVVSPAVALHPAPGVVDGRSRGWAQEVG